MDDVAQRERDGKRKSSQLDVLAEHLHRLRAACCHPQVGSSGIGGKKKLRTSSKRKSKAAVTATTAEAVTSTSVGTHVMTMEQILDRFIDDTKLKCEERQRLVLMNTNAMGAIKRLQVEAKERGVEVAESNASLLSASCKHYTESIELSEENAKPNPIVGLALLTGSTGFAKPREVIKDGVSTLEWKSTAQTPAQLWAQIDFEISRKVTQIRVRPIACIPREVADETSSEFMWHIMHPKDCVFQVSAAAVGGEFIDVASFSMPYAGAWIVQSGFRTNKSKSWRLLVKNFYVDGTLDVPPQDSAVGVYLGIDIELYEATIASDSLQRLHSLHNATISFDSLLSLGESDIPPPFSKFEIEEKIRAMSDEAEKIQSLYMEHALAVHGECKRRLQEAISHRKGKETSLLSLTPSDRKSQVGDCWDEGWWDDFLVMANLYGDETQKASILDRLLQDLGGYIQNRFEAPGGARGVVKFPAFSDINGFRTALNSRIRDIRVGLGKERSRKLETTLHASAAYVPTDDFVLPKENRFKCPVGGHAKCMNAIACLPHNPSGEELYENSHCKVCKADWNQNGPKCRHCKLGEEMEELAPDKVTFTALVALQAALRSSAGTSIANTVHAANISDRAKRFFEVLEAEKRETRAAWRAWRTHLDLMNDIDELNQCKTSMRLTYEGEDVTQLTEDQLNAVVVPVDLTTKYYDYAAKQGMCLGELRRAKETLRYLKAQNGVTHNQGNHQVGGTGEEKEHCSVCLAPFGSERSVLRCGHSFHVKCVEKLKEHARGHHIRCPMRCTATTDPKDVMIASSKRNDDGSLIKRPVKGSWGTKVTRIVSDVLDISDLGEKGIIFSQWEDMLDIVEHALRENGVKLVRAANTRKLREITHEFRTPDCAVLLLNVKNGAEGLTLIEATHVFMVEPLLNHGLDSQGTYYSSKLDARRTCLYCSPSSQKPLFLRLSSD